MVLGHEGLCSSLSSSGGAGDGGSGIASGGADSLVVHSNMVHNQALEGLKHTAVIQHAGILEPRYNLLLRYTNGPSRQIHHHHDDAEDQIPS